MNIQKQNISQIKNDKVFEFRYATEADDFCLLQSIKQIGQIRPIIIDQDGEIVDGNKLYGYLKSLGIQEVYTITIPVDNYAAKRLELNLWNKMIDPIPFYKKLKEIGQDKLESLNLPFKSSDLNGWVEMLSWDWDIYKNKQMNTSQTLW